MNPNDIVTIVLLVANIIMMLAALLCVCLSIREACQSTKKYSKLQEDHQRYNDLFLDSTKKVAILSNKVNSIESVTTDIIDKLNSSIKELNDRVNRCNTVFNENVNKVRDDLSKKMKNYLLLLFLHVVISHY
ncbi:hypothetical protein EDL81_02620 [Ehrlichia ruminantium]|uniref:hypothetical protein n=1 Tax=Ehrlichia ruminantium TaxID=779 RepID=UPI00130ED7D7|nr:hypothetical protein [Ehrlichia ruminantium]QGR02532.1 hypothetical protein EDL81_02620 [Ehrlichia ruminantium]